MRTANGVLFTTVLAALVVASAETQQTPAASMARNDSLLARIAQYFARPFNDSLRRALFDSAEARPDVSITVSPSVAPWMCYHDTAVVHKVMNAVLSSGFVIGNMRGQLRSGQKGDQPYAGLLGVLEVYASIRRRVLNYEVPEVEQFSSLEASGRLDEYADSVGRDPATECPKRQPRPGNLKLMPLADSTF